MKSILSNTLKFRHNFEQKSALLLRGLTLLSKAFKCPFVIFKTFRNFRTNLSPTYRSDFVRQFLQMNPPIEIPAARLKPKVLAVVFLGLRCYSYRLRGDSKEVNCGRSLLQRHGSLTGPEGPSS
jgi:hypothetical protein